MASRKQGQGVESLLSELCTTLGYCNAHRDVVRLVGLAGAGPEEFAREVIAVEGADTASSSAEQARRLVARHFTLWSERDAA
jgi:hypothetical protein